MQRVRRARHQAQLDARASAPRLELFLERTRTDDLRHVAAQTLASRVERDAFEASALAITGLAGTRNAARALDEMQLRDAERCRRTHDLLCLVAFAERLHEHDAGARDTRGSARLPE